MRTGIFCKSLLPLQCPVTLPGGKDARTKAPLAKGGCLGTAEAGGFRRLAGFHIGLYFEKVPAVNPSVKNQRFLPAPFRKGALRPVAADNFARESSAYRYCPSKARYRYLAEGFVYTSLREGAGTPEA